MADVLVRHVAASSRDCSLSALRARGGRVVCKTPRVIMIAMATAKRATIYFDPKLHRAIRRKAAAVDASISEVVNEAVRRSLHEDAADVAIFEKRRRERTDDFEEVVRTMKRRGKL